MALPPRLLMQADDLRVDPPVSTISTTCTSSWPVMRWPSANSDLRPSFSSVFVISGRRRAR
jgi:hypothetical protein